MAMALQHIPRWLWGRKSHGRWSSSSSSAASSSSSSAASSSESSLSSVSSHWQSMSVKSRRGRRKLNYQGKGRGRGRSDKQVEQEQEQEQELVLVPSDGGCGCISGSESDGSDWSIGWFEPHPPDFSTDNDNELDNSFAVLVPCYGLRPSTNPAYESIEPFQFSADANPNSQLLDDILSKHSAGSFSDDSKNFLEQWLSTLSER